MFYAVHQVLPPPKELLSLHSPTVRRYYDMASREGDISRRSMERTVVNATSRYVLWLVEQNYKLDQVAEDYVANRTAIEPVIDPEMLELYPDETYEGQTPNRWDTLRFISLLYSSTAIDMPEKNEPTLFDYSCNLWENAAYAFKHLTRDPTSSLCFELSMGDMNAIARKMTLEPEVRTRSNLPTQFLRAFTSNVPDYTGLILPLVEIIPMLLPSPKAFMRCNVLHSGMTLSTIDNWLEDVLLLDRAEEIMSMYGAAPLHGSNMLRFIWLGKAEEQTEQGPPLDEETLATSLQRLFMGIAFPPSQPGYSSLRLYPETLVVFVELLGSLLQRGVNPRWIARAVEEMLEGEGKLAIPNPRPGQKVLDKDEKNTVPIAPVSLRAANSSCIVPACAEP